jgi:murein DD-endopeptidase MepM/ murein hydrolase activator NlpD
VFRQNRGQPLQNKRPVRKSALLLTVVAAALLAAPQSAAAHAPGFKLPFACGASYRGTTYSGHGYGVDFNQANNADRGDRVLASAAGTVSQTTYVRSNGQITISHGSGWKTTYAHMSGVVVRYGQYVRRGQLLGYVNDVGRASGDHLHFEQRLNGTRVRSRFAGVLYRYGTWIRSTNAC